MLVKATHPHPTISNSASASRATPDGGSQETLVVQADVEGDAVLVSYDTHGVARAIDVFEQDYVAHVDST